MTLRNNISHGKRNFEKHIQWQKKPNGKYLKVYIFFVCISKTYRYKVYKNKCCTEHLSTVLSEPHYIITYVHRYSFVMLYTPYVITLYVYKFSSRGYSNSIYSHVLSNMFNNTKVTFSESHVSRNNGCSSRV